MGLCDAVRGFFGRPPHRERPPRTPLLKVVPGRQEQIDDLKKAKQANDRAALGVVITAGQAMRDESGVQAMMRGMLKEMDRGIDERA